MARFKSSPSGGLRTRLSSFAGYLEAVAELRTKLLHSSPSYLISNPEEFISLVEVAKNTLQNSGISLHLFSSCPDNLLAYKAAYFGLLQQLQAHSHDAQLESKDLQVRLNRLLFPLSTQLRVSTKSTNKAVHGGYALHVCGIQEVGDEHDGRPSEVKPVPLCPVTSPTILPSAERSSSLPAPPNLPPNAMLPPPIPPRKTSSASGSSGLSTSIPSEPFANISRREPSKSPLNVPSTLSSLRRPSHGAIHRKRRHEEPLIPHGICESPVPRRKLINVAENPEIHTELGLRTNESNADEIDNAESSSDSDPDSDNSDSDSGHIVLPSHSPLRRSLGIFCTSRGRGAFTNSVRTQRFHTRTSQRIDRVGLRRDEKEHNMDTDA